MVVEIFYICVIVSRKLFFFGTLEPLKHENYYKGAQPQSGFWVSLVNNQNSDGQKDVFVETQLPSEYEIEQEAKNYKFVISTQTQATQEGQKITFGLNMKSEQPIGDFCAAITLYYSGIVAAISFMLLAAYSLFNFLKY